MFKFKKQFKCVQTVLVAKKFHLKCIVQFTLNINACFYRKNNNFLLPSLCYILLKNKKLQLFAIFLVLCLL